MDPTGAGRMRGFRAPGADPTDRPSRVDQPQPSVVPEDQTPAELTGQAETLEIGGPPRPAQVRRPIRLRAPAGSRWLLAAASALVVAVLIIAALAFKLGTTSATAGAEASPTPSRTPAATATPLAVPDLYQQVVPSVVVITTAKGSLGSGTVVTDTGTVLTANHVIADGSAVQILFADGTKAAASVASADPKTDVATLTPKKLPEVIVPAVLGGGVAVGSDVVAIGNPLGLRYSTTTGVVSGLDRRSKTKSGTVTGLIQFDAAVNPGSSGGPLLNEQGLVIGVVVSIADPGNDEAFAGIGFAVPIGAALGGGGSGPGQGRGPQV